MADNVLRNERRIDDFENERRINEMKVQKKIKVLNSKLDIFFTS